MPDPITPDVRYRIQAYKSRRISVAQLDRIFEVLARLAESSATSGKIGIGGYIKMAFFGAVLGLVIWYLLARKKLIEEDLEIQKQGVEIEPPFDGHEDPPEEVRP